MKQLTYQSYQIVQGGGADVISWDNVDRHIVFSNGTITLAGNYSLNFVGSPQIGHEININYSASIELDGNSLTLLGRDLTQDEAYSDLTVIGIYTDQGWEVQFLKNHSSQDYPGVEEVIMGTSGNVTLVPGINKSSILVTGSPTLVGNWSIDGGGSPVDGDTFHIIYRATPITGSNTVSIFGEVIKDFEAREGQIDAYCTYDATNFQWEVTILREARGISDKFLISVPISFETGELLGTFGIQIPIAEPIKVNSVTYCVTTEIEGTDDAEITMAFSTLGIGFAADLPAMGNVDPLVIPMGSIVDTNNNTFPNSDNEAPANVSYLCITTDKTTPGGRVMLFLECERI